MEMPNDVTDQLHFIGTDKLKAPVAILVHDKKDMSKVSYLPFVDYSPEWQAIKWANAKEVPVQAIDLPMGYFKAEENYKSGLLRDFRKLKFSDPLGDLAKLAGYEDREQWWNETFEQHSTVGDHFHLVEYMMDNLRDEHYDADRETLVREAFMRKQIRTAAKGDYERMLVLVGAWHIPAVKQWQSIKGSADNALLKPLKKTRVEHFFIPWSYERISMASGYGAGVYSPAWYEHVFRFEKNMIHRWLIKAARLLRAKGFDVSPSKVSDAVLLSRQLAEMRALRTAGIGECWEALNTVMGAIGVDKMQLVWKALIIGDKVGKVDRSIVSAPLFLDLQKQLRSARMGTLLKQEERQKKQLDLRKPSNLRASRLFHRLQILDIGLGRLLKRSMFQKGSFSEHWSLLWKESMMIKLGEAGIWGTDIESASSAKLRHQLESMKDLGDLVERLQKAQLAGLSEQFDAIISRILDVLPSNTDRLILIEIIPPLIQLLRYGDLRNTSSASIYDLVDRLVPSVCAYLPQLIQDTSDEDADDVIRKVQDLNFSLGLLSNSTYEEYLNQALLQISRNASVGAESGGYCIRLLFDKKVLESAFVLAKMTRLLSPGQEKGFAALWLKGFLRSNPDLFIYNASFRMLVDQWVQSLSEEDFVNYLPTLRKAFGSLSAAKRGHFIRVLTEEEKKSLEPVTPSGSPLDKDLDDLLSLLLRD